MAGEIHVFQHPESWGWRFLISTPVWILGSAIAVVFPIVARTPFAIILIPVGLWSLAHVVSKLLLLASEIAVSETDFAARRYLWGSTRIRWDDIATIEEFANRTFLSGVVIRITHKNRGRSIVFTDAISEFPMLINLLKERARFARQGRMPLIWRVVLI